jgi:competence protein ComEA
VRTLDPAWLPSWLRLSRSEFPQPSISAWCCPQLIGGVCVVLGLRPSVAAMNLCSPRQADEQLAARVRDRVRALGPRPPGWVPDLPAEMHSARRSTDEARDPRLRGRRMRHRPRNAALAAAADRLPPQLRLLAVRRGHVAVLVAACLAALVWTVVLLVGGRSEAFVVPLRTTPTAAEGVHASPTLPAMATAASSSVPTAPEPHAAKTTPSVLVVHVSGLVQRPGLVQLPVGSRVSDALQAAGGPAAGAELATLNLARLVVDGEQIAVGVPPAPDASSAAGGSTAAPSSQPSGGSVDLNRATLQELDALPGVGPVLAQRILDWRTENGRFTSIEELQEIKGIGERTFAEISKHVRV